MEKRICVITGGTGGIGYHLSEGLHQMGYHVIALDMEMHKELTAGIDYYEVDLRHDDAVVSVFEDIVKKHGTIHVLINNAAITSFYQSIYDSTMDDFDQVFGVNVRGAFLCTKLFVLANRGEDYGRIINITSTRWHQNEANWELYGSSKGALVSMTNSLAISLADTPITVNAISPGWIQCNDYDDLEAEDHEQHPSGRVGKNEDILKACSYLMDEDNIFVNGHNLIVDGGMTKKMIYT